MSLLGSLAAIGTGAVAMATVLQQQARAAGITINLRTRGAAWMRQRCFWGSIAVAAMPLGLAAGTACRPGRRGSRST